MQPNLESLRHHYASLSDEALLDINRAELVEAARPLYDQEINQRNGTWDPAHDPLRLGVDPPDWIAEGAQIFSVQAFRPDADQYQIEDRRAALEAAGIPCFVEFAETKYDAEPAGKYREWKLLVPGKYNIEAMSIIERDVENADFATDWINHLEMLSDEELLNASPQRAFCGLFDKIERVTRAYENELERRKVKSNAT
jgi:hypothetical protein